MLTSAVVLKSTNMQHAANRERGMDRTHSAAPVYSTLSGNCQLLAANIITLKQVMFVLALVFPDFLAHLIVISQGKNLFIR